MSVWTPAKWPLILTLDLFLACCCRLLQGHRQRFLIILVICHHSALTPSRWTMPIFHHCTPPKQQTREALIKPTQPRMARVGRKLHTGQGAMTIWLVIKTIIAGGLAGVFFYRDIRHWVVAWHGIWQSWRECQPPSSHRPGTTDFQHPPAMNHRQEYVAVCVRDPSSPSIHLPATQQPATSGRRGFCQESRRQDPPTCIHVYMMYSEWSRAHTSIYYSFKTAARAL